MPGIRRAVAILLLAFLVMGLGGGDDAGCSPGSRPGSSPSSSGGDGPEGGGMGGQTDDDGGY